jgi:hydrogenase small subunit
VGDATVSRTGEVRNTTTIEAIDILWMTAGRGCDADTIAMTAARQASIEVIVTGALPWIPKVKIYSPFLAYEHGEEFRPTLPHYGRRKIGKTVHPRG